MRFLGGTQEARLAVLTDRKDAFYRAHRVQNKLSVPLSLNVLFPEGRANNFPSLHGPAVKASNTRSIIPWVAELAREFDIGTAFTGHRRKCAESLDDLYRLMYNEPIVFPRPALKRFQSLTRRCLRSYCWLSHDAIRSGRFMWHIQPKHHSMAEMAYQAEGVNPRFTQTYAGNR